jgi:hypothetical protein
LEDVYINKSMEAIKGILNDELIDECYTNFEIFKQSYDRGKIDYCIDKYVAAEMDYITPGLRGIGRMNEDVPRFGGYFRRQLSGVSKDILDELASLFKQSIYIGYLTHVLTFEEKPKNPNITSPQILFDKWIPGIYVSNIAKVPNLRSFLYGAVNDTMLEAKSIMKTNKLKGGGLFNQDKTDLILSFYPVAGFGLRARE